MEKQSRFAPDQILRMFLPVDFTCCRCCTSEQRGQKSSGRCPLDVPSWGQRRARGCGNSRRFLQAGTRAQLCLSRSRGASLMPRSLAGRRDDICIEHNAGALACAAARSVAVIFLMDPGSIALPSGAVWTRSAPGPASKRNFTPPLGGKNDQRKTAANGIICVHGIGKPQTSIKPINQSMREIECNSPAAAHHELLDVVLC